MPTIFCEELRRGPLCRPHRLVRQCVYDPITRSTRFQLVRVPDRDRLQLEGDAKRDLYEPNTKAELAIRGQVHRRHHTLEV